MFRGRTKILLLSMVCALAAATATPALAINPQPDPPGFQAASHHSMTFGVFFRNAGIAAHR
jgi:hypothetical protein